MTPSDNGTQTAKITAAEQLTALADRFNRAAQSMTRMVARLVSSEDGTKIVTSIAKYVNAGMPEAEAVADIAIVLEGSQSAEWQDRRAKERDQRQRQKLEWQLSSGHYQEKAPPNWNRAVILAAARERRDVIAAAVTACEQREDRLDILENLSGHLLGEHSIFRLQHALKTAGVSIQGTNVVPFIPNRGRS